MPNPPTNIVPSNIAWLKLFGNSLWTRECHPLNQHCAWVRPSETHNVSREIGHTAVLNSISATHEYFSLFQSEYIHIWVISLSLSLYIYIYIYMCMCAYLSLSLSIYIYTYIYISLSLSLYIYIYIYTWCKSWPRQSKVIQCLETYSITRCWLSLFYSTLYVLYYNILYHIILHYIIAYIYIYIYIYNISLSLYIYIYIHICNIRLRSKSVQAAAVGSPSQTCRLAGFAPWSHAPSPGALMNDGGNRSNIYTYIYIYIYMYICV